MRQIRTANTKERMLRAYTNSPEPPKGFRGNPYPKEEGLCEHNITTHNLARWLYLSNAIDRGLKNFGATRGKPHEGEFLSKETFKKWEKWLDKIYLGTKKAEENKRKILDRFRTHEQECWERINRSITNGISGVALFPDRFILRNMEDDKIEHVRKAGSVAFFLEHIIETLDYMRFMTRETANMESIPAERKRLAGIEMDFIFATVVLEDIKAGFMERKDKSTRENGLGRGIFTKEEQIAYNFVSKLLERIEFRDVLAAVTLAYGSVDLDKLAKIYHMHERYYLRFNMNVNGIDLEVTGSPFAEKPVGRPIGDYSLQAMPVNQRLKKELKEMDDWKFEHANGAVATARLKITGDERMMIMCEEIQSDQDTLVRIHNKTPSPELRLLLEKYPEIALEAARKFAGRIGVESVYLATPARVIIRYEGMHPHKLGLLYFKFPEREHGEMVFDDGGELDKPAYHYYRFASL